MVRAIVGHYLANFVTGICLRQDHNNGRCFDDLTSWTLRSYFPCLLKLCNVSHISYPIDLSTVEVDVL